MAFLEPSSFWEGNGDSAVTSVLGFLIILAPLVIVHEFGHFLFAKLFKVKAEAFSVGFGPRLFKKQVGETEFRVSAIPLGGYVKLLGEEPGQELPPELKHRSLQAQAPWKRFFIFFGGPLFNFLFAIVVFMAILAIGEPQLANTVGRVEQGSYAESEGFQPGDRILEINGEKIKRYKEFLLAVNAAPGKTLNLKVLRKDKQTPIDLEVKTQKEIGYTIYGEEKFVGVIPGLSPVAKSPTIGVSDPKSVAGQNGLETGDRVIQWENQSIQSFYELEKAYQNETAPIVSVVLQKSAESDQKKVVSLKLPKKKISLDKDLGIFSSELFIRKTVSDSPAANAGLQEGDRFISIGGSVVNSFDELKETIQKATKENLKQLELEQGKTSETAMKAQAETETSEIKPQVPVQWERNGKRMEAMLTPQANQSRDPSLRKQVTYTIGIMPYMVLAKPETVVEREWNPFLLLAKGTFRMLEFSWRNLVSIGKMVTGDVSVATLGGPILIGKIAGDSLERGLIAFLTTMALLSVGLGILNILPIPVLDGGHILLLGVEAIRGKPLTLKQMELVQQVGLSLILLLMVVVMRNDITRLPLFN